MSRANNQRKMIRLPAPVASVGDKVLVRNYRRGGALEDATVTQVTYKCRSGWWDSYDVFLDRRSAAGNGLRLYLSRDGIHSVVK